MGLRSHSRMWLFVGSLLALSTGTGAVSFSQDGRQADTFRSEVAKIEIQRPPGWHFQNPEAAVKSSARAKATETQEAFRRLGTTPLIVVTKHPEPYKSLNPALYVIVRSGTQFPGQSAIEITRSIKAGISNVYSQFQVVDDIRSYKVSGYDGGRMTVQYLSATRDGREFANRSTFVFIPRGSNLYQLSISAPPDGTDALDETMRDRILRLVHFLE
jgi:hypothetical protein